MEREMRNLIRVWAVAIASSCYSYSLTRIFHIPKGVRMLFIIPVIYLFTVLPFSLSTIHLGGSTLVYLVWLGNFKLLLYSFGLGPLCAHPNMSLLHFICVSLLPVNVKDEPMSNTPNGKFPPQGKKKPVVMFCVKLVAFALVVKIYDYKDDLPTFVFVANYFCHIYLGVEAIFAVSAALARATLGLDLAPQFNEPYLTTSLQDFWGRRWNLMVSDILRLSVYNPIRRVVTPLAGRRWAVAGGTVAAFTVSGLMHEVIFFYCTRVSPTWEVTWFFVLQGVCNAAEVAAKEEVAGRFRLHRVVSGLLTIGFVGYTGEWLFLPQISRNGVDLKAVNEYYVMIDFVKQKCTTFI